MTALGKTIVWPAPLSATVIADVENEGFYKASVKYLSYAGAVHAAEGRARSIDRALAIALHSLIDGIYRKENK